MIGILQVSKCYRLGSLEVQTVRKVGFRIVLGRCLRQAIRQRQEHLAKSAPRRSNKSFLPSLKNDMNQSN